MNLILFATLALGAPGTEIALVLDNSCSMVAPSQFTSLFGTKMLPANDPERTSVLGTLIVEGLARDTEDRLTVIAFGDNEQAPARVVTSAADIRQLPPVGGTYFRNPLMEAKRRLEASTLDGRLLLFFTDGAPNDIKDPAEGPRLAGLDVHPEFDSFILGLYGSEDSRALGEGFLRPLARTTDDLVFMNDPSQVVAAFTRGYARALGSKPTVGTLQAGDSRVFEVPRYVVELLAVTASSKPGPPFTAALTGPAGPVAAKATGDNGCVDFGLTNAPRLCDPPRRHFADFRAPNDWNVASQWTLSLPAAPGPVEFGVIYRYDLTASVIAPPRVQIGEAVPVSATLQFRGVTFDDPAFFGADGFEAILEVGGQTVPLTAAPGGQFSGLWTPDSPADADNPAIATVTFRNTWLEVSNRQKVVVEGFLDLVLRPTPSPLDLGTWQGDRAGGQRCAEIDLSGSTHADRVPVTCSPNAAPEGFTVSCGPVPGSEATIGNAFGRPLRYAVCLEAPACCGAASSPGTIDVEVRLAGTHPHYAAAAVVVPVRFNVEATGFLRCWWPAIAAAAGAGFALFVLAGLVRPHSFDPATAVRIAGSEAGVKRADAANLRDRPGGKRGFYRHARLCITADGDCVKSPRLAMMVVEAMPGYATRIRKAASLERKNRSSGKWEVVPPTDFVMGVVPGEIYRLGSLHLKFE